MKWSFFTSLVFICITASAQQQYRFMSYNVSQGLSQNSVHCIFQDSDGILWLGTQDGLNSFDGLAFKAYKHNPKDTTTISDQFVLGIGEDAKGFIWAETRSGFNRFNKQTGQFQRYYASDLEKNSFARTAQSLTISPQKELCFSSNNELTFINTNGKIISVSMGANSIRLPEFDGQGLLWGFNSQKKLSTLRLHNHTITQSREINTPTQLSQAKTSIKSTLDKKGYIWCYQEQGTNMVHRYHIPTNTWQTLSLPFNTVINHIGFMANSKVWISTSDGILVAQGETIIQHISYKSNQVIGLPPGGIQYCYEDKQGNIWVGMAGGGIAYYNPAFDNYRTYATGNSNDLVTGWADVPHGRWLAAASGLHLLTKENNVVVKTLFPGKKIKGLAVDGKGRIWAAVQGKGLYALDAQGRILQSYTGEDSSLQTRNILHLQGCKSGNLVVCTERGYFVFLQATQRWQSFYQDNRTGSPTGWYTMHAFEDSKGKLWLSKQRGIDVLDKNLQLVKEMQSNGPSSPISRTLITGVSESPAGHIWIGTLGGGLYSYQNDKLKQYTNQEGLSSNIIYGMVPDAQQRLWITTTAGVNVFVPSENRFYSLNANDGLTASDYVLGSIGRSETGEVLLGSSNGLIEVKAGDVVLKQQLLQARVSHVKLNGINVVTQDNRYTVQPGYKSIGFELSVKQALLSRNIIYQYRMQGSEKEWTTLTPGANSIIYSSLPFGELNFEVRAAYTPQDLAAAPTTSFRLTVQHAFWQTLWFKLLLGILAATAVFISVQRYNKAKYKKQLEALRLQKELQQERSRISRDLHDNIGAYTSALIAGINELKRESAPQPGTVDELSEYAAGIMGYLRETIWVLNNEKLTLTAFTDRFKNYATRIIKNYPAISLHFSQQMLQERELAPQASLNLFRILQEALQNACKHSGATAIEIGIEINDKISFSITDNGTGIPNEKRDNGYGLQNMQYRAAEIGYVFTCGPGRENGTVVTVTER
jgi:signal transduction histidine kinase/ligand-binding sensor domain-containing protein